MADLSIRFFSNCLKRTVEFKMFLPNDKRNDIPWEDEKHVKGDMKTILLLHGYTGDGDIWVNREQAASLNIAVVAPSGDNSFWLDGEATGRQYASYIGVELIRYVRDTFGIAMTPDKTGVMGLSMGGFGALHTALMFPETFGVCAALSSALIHNEVAKMKEGEGNSVANYAYYRECFGDPTKLHESDNNPEVLAKKLKAEGKKIPKIFMACGTEDFLLEPNRAFDKFLTDTGIDHVYEESEGIHDMKFWSKYAEIFMPRMFD